MIRTIGLKTDFIQKETLNEELGVYMVRWDYRPITTMVREDPEDENSELVETETDYATWVQERYYHDPTVNEIKNTMIKWCNIDCNKKEFCIDGNKCILSESDRAALRIKCEYNTDETVSIPCGNTILEFDTDIALQIIIRLNDYYEGVKKVLNDLVSQINAAESLEDLAEINFNPTFPERVDLDSSEMTQYAEEAAEKEEMLSQLSMFATYLINQTSLTNTYALSVNTLYPAWEDCIGGSLSAGDRVVYQDVLYNVIEDVAEVLETETPDKCNSYMETAHGSGTKEDPFVYNNNMKLVQNYYYIQNDTIYLCTVSTEITVTADLESLVGTYVVKPLIS